MSNLNILGHFQILLKKYWLHFDNSFVSRYSIIETKIHHKLATNMLGLIRLVIYIALVTGYYQ